MYLLVNSLFDFLIICKVNEVSVNLQKYFGLKLQYFRLLRQNWTDCHDFGTLVHRNKLNMSWMKTVQMNLRKLCAGIFYSVSLYK
jgi:hypothetical protein